MKPFDLEVPFSPRWRQNRKRDPEDQITLHIRDINTRQKSKLLKELKESKPESWQLLAGTEERKNLFQTLEADIAWNEWAIEVGKKYTVSVTAFPLKDVDGTHEIKTVDDLEKYAPDILTEVAFRLILGPDEDELKNS